MRRLAALVVRSRGEVAIDVAVFPLARRSSRHVVGANVVPRLGPQLVAAEAAMGRLGEIHCGRFHFVFHRHRTSAGLAVYFVAAMTYSKTFQRVVVQTMLQAKFILSVIVLQLAFFPLSLRVRLGPPQISVGNFSGITG